jgi:hypothetical protein
MQENSSTMFLSTKKTGIAIEEMHLPTQIKIEASRRSEDNWTLNYEETVDAPDEVIENSVEISKGLGFNVIRKGKTIAYTIEGDRNTVFSMILGEALVMCNLGDITLREILVLAGIGKKKGLNGYFHDQNLFEKLKNYGQKGGEVMKESEICWDICVREYIQKIRERLQRLQTKREKAKEGLLDILSEIEQYLEWYMRGETGLVTHQRMLFYSKCVEDLVDAVEEMKDTLE